MTEEHCLLGCSMEVSIIDAFWDVKMSVLTIDTWYKVPEGIYN
jgi:hypothetical protein